MAAGPCQRPTARQVWCLAPAHERTQMFSRAGGGTTDQPNNTINNLSMQELASAGPAAIESFGPEPGGEVVHVEISCHDRKRDTFRLRCGLVSAGGAS